MCDQLPYLWFWSPTGELNFGWQVLTNAKRLGVFLEDFPGFLKVKHRICFLLDGLDYYDYDMKNADPTILLHLCKGHRLQCGALQNYVEHREQILKEY